MSRYIEADAFKEDVKHHLSVLAYAGSHAIGLETLSHWFDTAPSIDICFCRECVKHNTHRCHMAFDLIATEDDDFCSYGEREEE